MVVVGAQNRTDLGVHIKQDGIAMILELFLQDGTFHTQIKFDN